jgi:hypothetical protein
MKIDILGCKGKKSVKMIDFQGLARSLISSNKQHLA